MKINYERWFIFCALLLIVFEGGAFASDNKTHFSFNGEVLDQNEYFPCAVNSNNSNEFAATLGLHLDFTCKLNDNTSVRLNSFMDYNFHDSNLNRVQFSDAYIDYYSTVFDIRIGDQVFTWGNIAMGSALDILNPLDYERNLIFPEKIGIPAIRSRWILNLLTEHTFSLFVIPYFQNPILPEKGNRYYLFGNQPQIDFDSDTAMFDSKYGKYRPQAAIGYNSSFNGFVDLEIYYFNGYKNFPVFSFIPTELDHVRAIERYPLINFIGIGVGKPLFECVLKAQAAHYEFTTPVYSQSNNNIRIRGYEHYSAGIEREFPSLFNGMHSLNVNLLATAENDLNADSRALEGVRFFRSSVMIGLNYNFNDVALRQLTAFGDYDYIRHDFIVLSHYEQHLLKYLTIGLTFDGPVITDSQDMKLFAHNYRFSGEIGYRW